MKGKGHPFFASKPRATQLESPGLKQAQKVESLSFHLSPTFNPSKCAKSLQYWSELPFPPPKDLLDSRIKPVFPALQLGFFTTEPLGKSFLINPELLKPKRISGKEVRDWTFNWASVPCRILPGHSVLWFCRLLRTQSCFQSACSFRALSISSVENKAKHSICSIGV